MEAATPRPDARGLPKALEVNYDCASAKETGYRMIEAVEVEYALRIAKYSDNRCCSGGLWPPSFGAQRAPLQEMSSLYFAILNNAAQEHPGQVTEVFE